ncbi:MAG TPA: sugar dehydratase, partial [Solirubrobacteraceae bacterium]|nr:sugar dehydratase [Solirubrobacteraceae bacterium]
GTPHRVVDVVRLICRLAGRPDLEPGGRGTARPGGTIDRRWVDASRLRGLTGWEPRVGLEDGLRRTIDWYRAHPGGLAPA